MHDELTDLLGRHARALGLLPPARIPLRPVRRGVPGDWSTALAHTLAGPGRPAGDIARALAGTLRDDPALAAVHADGASLTLTLTTAALAGGVQRLLERPAVPGREETRCPPAVAETEASLRPVAFAHARCRNVARVARAHGVRPVPGEELEHALAAVVEEETTRELLVLLGAFAPARGVGSRTDGDPPAGLRVLLGHLAATYQDFYAGTRTAPRGAEPVTSIHGTHLTLTEATSAALAAGLTTLGIPAPEHL